MRYCDNCGEKSGDENFCTNCGKKLSDETKIAEKKSNRPKTTLKIFAGIIVIAAIIGSALFFMNNNYSYKATVKCYINAIKNGDAKKIVSLMPKATLDYTVKEYYDGDKSKMINDLKEEIDEITDDSKISNKADINLSNIKYEITGTDFLDLDDIEYIEDDYKDGNMRIKEGLDVNVKITIPLKNAKTDSNPLAMREISSTQRLELIKVGSKWYIYDIY